MSSKEKSAGSSKSSSTSAAPEKKAKSSKPGEEQTMSRGLSFEEWRAAMNGEASPTSTTVPAEASAGAIQMLSAMSVTVTMQAMLNVFSQSIKDAIAKIESRLDQIEAKVGRLPTIEAEVKTVLEKMEDLQRSIDEHPRVEPEDVEYEAPREKEQPLPAASIDVLGPDGERERPAGNSRRSRSPARRSRSPAQKKRRISPVRRSMERTSRSSACIFCGNYGHESDGCSKIHSGKVMRDFAMRKGLCLGCGTSSCKQFECKSRCAYCEEAAKDKLSLHPMARLEQMIPHGHVFCTLPTVQFNRKKRFF